MKNFVTLYGEILTLGKKSILFRFENYGKMQDMYFPHVVVEDPSLLQEGDPEINVAEWFCIEKDICP